MLKRFAAIASGPLLLAVLVVLLVWPLICLVSGSLHEGNSGGAWTLDNYTAIFQTRSSRVALFHSIWISLGVAAAAVVICLGPAWLFVRHDFPGKRIARAVLTLPMSFSGILIGFLCVIMLGRIGVVPRLMEWLTGTDYFSGTAYQLGGILIAYFYFEIPRATLSLESALRKLDPRLELAACSLGAGAWQRFTLVVLPQLWPALLATFALTFCVSLGSFGVVLIVAKRFSLLPLEVFEQIIAFNRYPLAAAMSVVLLAIALCASLTARWATHRLTHVR